MRSKLFVPGARPEIFAKAVAGEADALSFDLEDSVPEAGKAGAREAVEAFVQSDTLRDSGKRVVVRVNALDSPHFAEDMLAMARPGVDWINLPKPGHPADVLQAVQALEQAERRNGVSIPICLLVTIETPGALRQAAAIARAHPRVVGLQLGLADLFEPLCIDRGDPANVRQVMMAMRLAAGEAGILACDAAFTDLHDEAGFVAEARMARSLGYVGKTCIHPGQVPLANAHFGTTADEVAAARRIVEQAVLAGHQGHGAFLVDGRMVDAPILARARAVLAAAGGVGIVSGQGS